MSLPAGAGALGPRMNLPWARDVMARLGLQGLVLARGINVYHASGFWPVTTRMGFPPTTFALLSADQTQPVALVLPSFVYYYQLADLHDPGDLPVYQYTVPDVLTDAAGGEAAQDSVPGVFPDRAEVSPGQIEHRREARTRAEAENRRPQTGAAAALRRALRDLGLAEGALAMDHAALGPLLQQARGDGTAGDAEEALRHIRLIKTPQEIQLMRRAASANAAAALAAVQAVRAGAGYRELRSTFYAEAARRGNRGVFMVVDRVSAESYDAAFREGQTFFIDAVSEGAGYHGDYARTVFIGEPAPAMARAARVIAAAWDEVRESLKPGLRFSEIQARGRRAVTALGGDYAVPFKPHSVGLYHTDHCHPHTGAGLDQDLVLGPGMVISVDCPLMEAGVGGSAHIEDLMLITAAGAEPLNDPGNQLITL